jgi:DNA-binding NarL/FixJ family response regulator
MDTPPRRLLDRIEGRFAGSTTLAVLAASFTLYIAIVAFALAADAGFDVLDPSPVLVVAAAAFVLVASAGHALTVHTNRALRRALDEERDFRLALLRERGDLLSPAPAEVVEAPAAALNGATPVRALSPRELEVLQLVASGFSNQDIAHSLGIGLKTVEVHTVNIRKKLPARNRVQMVRYALRSGLVQLTEEPEPASHRTAGA